MTQRINVEANWKPINKHHDYNIFRNSELCSFNCNVCSTYFYSISKRYDFKAFGRGSRSTFVARFLFNDL